MRQFQHYIDGRFEVGSASFESIDPATGEPWANVPEAGTEDVNRAVDAARRVLKAPEWAELTASQRGRCSIGSLIWWRKMRNGLANLKHGIPGKSFAKPPRR